MSEMWKSIIQLRSYTGLHQMRVLDTGWNGKSGFDNHIVNTVCRTVHWSMRVCSILICLGIVSAVRIRH